jgi:hypothetical protein
VKRASLVLALTPLMSVPLMTAAFAGSSGTTAPLTTTVTTHTDAPPASASAAAANIDGVITIGGTSTSAGSSGSQAHADSLDLFGTRIEGGDASSSGKTTNSGALLDTGSTPLGQVAILPWSASASGTSAEYKSAADAALAYANVANLAQVWVLHSHSASDWTPDKSTGDSSSDGAEVSALGLLDIKVLHAEAHSGQTGSSALLVVNGTGIGTSQQANGACQLNLSPVLDLICLTANGGTGSNGVTTSGGTVANVTGVIPGTTLSGASSQGGVVAGPPTSPKTPHKLPHTKLPHTGKPAGGKLPFTGSDVGVLAVWAAAITAMGASLTAIARRRRYVTV